MKKILSLVLALLMSASAASFVGAAEEVPAIAEEDAAVDTLIAPAPETSQYDEAIKFLNSYGIYKGKSADNLAAADPIERYQMALFVARISTGWVDDSKWADVVADQWYDRDHDVSGFDDLEGTPAVNYLGALSYASQKGIIQGYGNKKFGPTDGITYQDALTMVVRTLGYGNNLAWPWGYIEKAVTIGLTKGISTSVKYTDKLNRGEVAQIIYNALFAPTALGDTLAARNFNGELGWETIIITGTGVGRFLPGDILNGDKNVYDLKDAVAFRVVDVNGELKGDTYFVKNAEAFGFDEHTERYLGYAFKALFTKDADSNYVTLVSAKPLLDETIWNFGLGKKAEDGDKWAIQDYLSGKTLVSKFSKNTYLNAQNGAYGLNNEFILKNALQIPGTYKNTSSKYAIDWVKGDILVKDDEGTIKTSDGTYTVVWNYNDKLGLYFKIKTDAKDGTVIGIDLLDEKDLEKLLESRDTYKAEGGLATITSVSTTAYASLKTFTLNDAPAANYGLYEEYRLGKLNIGTKDCSHGTKTAWSVTALDAVAKASWEAWNDADHPYGGYKSVDKTIIEGQCDHGTLWLSEESVEGYTPADGDYIIYSYDYATCELKVVKVIGKGDAGDKDNFVTTGIVRAYSVPDKSVTIGENTYKYDYTELAGNGLNYNADKTIARAAYTDLFRGLFNQYVTYVVVDGKIVYIERTGETKNLIVVSSYAGLSSDGYIVVNGWNTADLKYGQFRIGAYDSWFKGDMYYYYDDARATSYFSRGALYTITSYDDKNDAYYVTSAFMGTTTNQGGTTRWYDFGLLPKAYDWNGNFEYNLEVSNGYKQVYYINPADGKKVELGWEKTKSSDKYIIMVNPDNNDWAPIIVFSGKAGNGWFINNGRKVDIGNGDVTFVLVRNWSDVFGFNRDQYDLSYVLFLGYNYESASYDGADGTTPYLLGASTYTARVFDIYTGTETVKVATNQKLLKGYVYPSYDGAIVNDGITGISGAGYTASQLNNVIPAAYTHAYVYGGLNAPAPKNTVKTFDLADKKDNSFFNKEVFSKKVLSKNNADEYKLGTKEVKDLCTGVKVFLVGSNGITINKLVEVSYDDLKALNDAGKLASLDFWYIQKRNGDAVVYINAAEPAAAATPADKSDKPSDLIDRTLKAGKPGNELGIDIPAYIDTTFSGSGNGKTITINKINLDYIGKGTTDTHKNVQEHKFYFGEFGYCSLETMEVAVDGDRVYGALHTDLYTPHADELDTEFCKLIKGVGFALPKNITVAVPEYRNGQFVAQLLNKDGSAVQVVPATGTYVTGDPILDPTTLAQKTNDAGEPLFTAVYEVLTPTVDADGNNVVKSSPIWVRVQVADDIGNVFDIYYTVCVEATFYVNTGYTNNTLKGYNLVVEIDQSISTPAAFVPVSAAVK